MSLTSMTGCGRGQAVVSNYKAEVELTSVNRKQLDIHLNIPRGLSSWEPGLLKLVRTQLQRGRITGVITASRMDVGEGRVQINKGLAKSLLDGVRTLAVEAELEDDLKASHLLLLKDLFTPQDTQTDPEAAWPAVQKAMRSALRQLRAMRRAEGEQLKADMEKRLGLLAKRVTRIERRSPKVVAEYRKRLSGRLAEVGFDLSDASEQRLARELALFADRCDISEECVRLRSHFDQANTLLNARGAVGRTFDFLIQEMLREINTIGSKANDLIITKEVVAFKSELEQVREQVQNIE